MTKTETHTNKTILRVLLAAAVVLLFCGAAVGAVGAEAADHTHAGVTFTTPWGSNSSEQTSLPSTSGSYYLTNDVTLSGIWNVPNGETTLCLNGSVIKMTGNGCVIRISSDAKLNLYDCGTTLHYFTVDSDGLWKLATDQTTPTDYSVTGGYITGGTGDNGSGGGVKVSGGTFTLYGGNIVGNTANIGGGVYITTQGSFTMNSGCIIGNTANDNSGGVGVNNGIFTMTGGTISNNTASIKGGGVRVNTNGTFNVRGTPFIKDNMQTDGTTADNVYLESNKFITVTGELTGDANIGIANPLGGKFGTFDPLFTPGEAQKVTIANSFHQDSDNTMPCLVPGNDLYWPVAKIEANYYATVQAAVSAATAGQTITMIADSTEPMITVGKKVTLDLNGHVLKNDGSESDKSVIKVTTDGDLEVTDTSTTGNEHYFRFAKNGPWTLYGGTPASSVPLADFDRAAAEAATVPYYVKVTGGCITGGNTNNNGGGVYITGQKAVFTLSGGNIVGNDANEGGGIYFESPGGKFTMNAGNIVGNNAIQSGGGVRAHVNGSERGTFEMNGGRIVGNTSNGGGAGGGVYVEGNTTFKMTNGSIVGNRSGSGGGGGVAVYGEGIFEMTGGHLVGNTALNDGGGVYVAGGTGTFNVSGAPVIKDNKTNETANNVRASYNTSIKLTGPLTGGEIRITMAGGSAPLLGEQFGTTELTSGGGAGHFVADVAPSATPLVGSIGTDTESNKILVWKEAGIWDGGVFIPNPNGYATAEAFANALNKGDHSGTAGYDASTKTVKLLKDVVLSGTPLKLGGNSENPFILDLGGMTLSRSGTADNFSVITVESEKFLTLDDSVGGGKITGGKAIHGGGVMVEGTFTMNGGCITENTAECDAEKNGGFGGGVYVSNHASFVMTGGSITNNTAAGGGGGVYVDEEATFKVSDSPVIKDNKDNNGATNNVVLDEVDEDSGGIILFGDFTGDIRITLVGGKVPVAGEPFGWVTGSPSGAENFKADGSNFFGSISDGKLVWKAPASKPSSKPQGSSSWASIPVTPAGSADPREAAAHVVTEDISNLYIGTVFTPVSSAEITRIEAVSPESAALLTAALDAAAADGIPLTNSKGAKAIVNTADKIPGAQTTAAFTQVFDVESSDGTWVTAVPFKVRLSDLSAKNLTTDDVTLYHYLEEYDIWIPLETGLVSTDDVYAYYEAATDGASPFGVLLKKLDEPEVKPLPSKTPAGKSPVPFLGVLAGLGAAAVVFGLRMRR